MKIKHFSSFVFMSTLSVCVSIINTELLFFTGFIANVHIKVILETSHNMLSKNNWYLKLI